MDKYEFKLSLEEINRLIQERRFAEAADIADTIDWNHVRSPETLGRVSEVYKLVGDYGRSRDVMAIAYQRAPENPAVIYSLCELSLYLYGQNGLQEDLTRSLTLMQEYQTAAPDNPKGLILQYKMYEVSHVSAQEKIAVLEQLKRRKPTARWEYELAGLYAQTGETEKAVALCRDVSEIFGGRYGERAQQLEDELRGSGATQQPAVPGTATEPDTEESAGGPEPGGAVRREWTHGSEEDTEEERETPSRDTRDERRYEPEPAPADGAEKPDEETGQTSINEVMAEWERIRADIRRANDEKRAQRILEDTGSILQNFDETARHGLLEDIEKGVARQRRQARSGVYRMTEPIPETPGRDRPVRDGSGQRQQYRREPYREEPEQEEPYPEEPYREEPEQEEPEQEEPYPEEPEQEEPYTEEPDRKKADRKEPCGEERRAEASGREDVPEDDEDGDIKIYGGDPETDDSSTRRWNPEEVHRAMARRERLTREQARRNIRARKEQDRRQEPEEEPEHTERRQADPGQEELYDGPVYEEPIGDRVPHGKPLPKEPVYEEPEDEEPAPPGEQDTEENITEPVYDEPDEKEQTPGEPVREEEPGETFYDDQEPVKEAEPSREEPPEEKTAEDESFDQKKIPGNRTGKGRKEPGPEEPPAAPDAVPPTGRHSAGQGSKENGKTGSSGKRELTKEERRLFGPFCRMQENVNQLTEALDQISLASSTGNLMILGNEATADRIAKGILEVLRHSDANFVGRVAKAGGESLNRLNAEGIAKTVSKLESGALIVTRAADIAPKTMKRLSEELEGHEHGIVLILTDSGKRMEQFRKDNEAFLGSFTAVINIRPLDDKALVAYARDYAFSQDYSIDEFGQLALAQRISSMQTSTHHVTLQEVRSLVDEAIGYASKKNPHMLMEIISRKRYDADDRIILHENDFTHY